MNPVIDFEAGQRTVDDPELFEHVGSFVEPLENIPEMLDDEVGEPLTPIPEDVLASFRDRNWFDQQKKIGAFEAYRGLYIAIHNEKILGSGKSTLALRKTVHAETGVPESRIVILKVWDKHPLM